MPGILKRRRILSVSNPVFSTQANALFNAMNHKPTIRQKTVYDYVIKYLISTGDWVEMDVFNVPYALDEQAATLNWKNPSDITYALIPTNYGTTFTAKSGWPGNSGNSTYIRTGFIPSSSGVKYTLNNCGFFVYLKDNLQDGSNIACGSYDGTNFSLIRPRNGSDQLAGYANETTGNFASNTDSSGVLGIKRTASNSTTAMRNGTTLNTTSNASTALPTREFYLGARNSNGTASLFITNTIQAWGAGSKDINQANIKTAIDYLKANL